MERRGAHRVLVEKPEGKILLERPRRRCDDNVVVYVKKIVLEGMKWIDLAENRDRQWVVVKKVVNFRFP